MRRETIAIHGGYEVDPTTKAVAVPIYQTVAYSFDSADHGAALFNLEGGGHREKRIDAGARTIVCKSVANPAGNVCDIEPLARVAHNHGVPLIVDNTVATPILLRPIDYGADIVVHSLTKFMGGHGTTLGGAIVDSGRFPWAAHAARFPMFTRPDASYHGLVYVEQFKGAAYIARCRSVYQRTTGAVLSPLSAFLLLQGIETVALRIDRHVENCRRGAGLLRHHRRGGGGGDRR